MSHLDRYVVEQCLVVFAFFTLIFVLVIVKLVESVVTEPARTNLDVWYLVYVPSVVGLIMFWALMYLSINPHVLRKQSKLSRQNT